MNIVQLQDQLKNFSQDQLVREMQMPSGSAPQFLVLGEIMRRQKMQQDFTAQQAKGDQGTVAQEAVAAAGVPQGGIADMARAMAPSTDMTQNTGVQAMYAGGPVKKMAKGDKVKTDPAVIAMANRAGMSVGQYLEALGEEEAARVVAGAEQRAARNRMMAMEPIGEGITFPTQADLDRSFQEEQFAFDASRPLVAPTAIDMPTVPSVPARVIGGAPTAPVAPGLPALAAVDSAPSADFTSPPLSSPYLPQKSALVLAQEEYDRNAPEIEAEEARQEQLDQTARTMAAIQAERAPLPETGGRGIAYRMAQENPAYDPLRGAVVDDLLGGLGGRTTEEQERILKDRAAAEAATPEAMAEEAKKAKEEGRGGAVPAGDTAGKTTPAAPPGGTTPSGGAGGAGSASSYEQALMDALSSREKAAQQDKWLALAQVGLNLMSSRQPTLGGALGEAGLKGVEAARTARDTYDKEKLEILGALETSRAARAKAAKGSGGLSGIKLSQYLPQLRYAADAAADRVSLLTGGMDPNMAISMAEEEGDNARAVEIRRAYDDALQANSDYTNVVRNIGGLEGFAPEEDDTSFSARE
jgi:hypothetical protein